MKQSSLGRVYLLDEIRGFAILCMVIYHFTYDLLYFFDLSFPFFHSSFLNFIRDIFAGGFIFISGIACRFSKNNLRRGIYCFLFGMIMTVGSLLFVPDLPIYFGILHLLGCCMILFGLLNSFLDKFYYIILFVIFSLFFFATYHLPIGQIGFPFLGWFSLPQQWYSSPYLFWLGFPSADFYSADYFPLLPWLFLFLAGSCLGIPIRDRKFPNWFYPQHSKILSTIGRHTIWIYLAHQPIIFGILYLLKVIFYN